jgi:hypothetical protein
MREVMPEKSKPLQGKPIRGNDTLTVPHIGYIGKVPSAAIQELEQEAAGLIHGIATLTLHVKDGNLIRYATNRERSFVSGRPMTGSAQ